MVYVIGNRFHATLKTFADIRKPTGEPLNSDDTLIVIGHFYIENFLVDREQELDKIEKRIPYTIIGLSGDYGSYFGNPDEFPDDERFGGTVKRIRNNVFQLYGGTAYHLEGKKLFVFNGAVSKGDPEYDLGLKCLEENDYSFDYILSNHSMLSTVIYFMKGIRNIDLSRQTYLDKHLVNTNFKEYLFAQGPAVCPLVRLITNKDVYELGSDV